MIEMGIWLEKHAYFVKCRGDSIDKPGCLIAVPEPLLTEVGIHHRQKSCE